jgi:hypothetical protein
VEEEEAETPTEPNTFPKKESQENGVILERV